MSDAYAGERSVDELFPKLWAQTLGQSLAGGVELDIGVLYNP